MKELPTPTLPLIGMLDFRAPRQVPVRRAPVNMAAPMAGDGAFEVLWARHQDEVREAQALRYRVFAQEMGASLRPPPGTPEGLDVDLFDDFCEHLIVRSLPQDDRPAQVIGTYRVLTPGAARRAGGYYSDTEFDLTRLRPLRERLAELGRSCVDPDHRSGGVILALWGALASFMDQNGLDAMVGCASISMRDGGHAAASIWQRLSQSHLAPVEHQVRPRHPLPVDELNQALPVEPPALIKGYLRVGAKVLGAPAWDPDFNTADLPMLMRLGDLPSRYRRHFLGGL
ncbi:GNAT family N-acetyltransferase [Ideonella oryzae]|uniref:L-ornithine N(alpha)-acyltransferase n=1 Tax=Ideonella oryzae TaxID=2937441 RepID=A0ABT1BPI5_9BURK|nr:GNAT family N-acyltransferase [Ideonella oryzae]MCO5977486.1 GNAT family N-acetyltransferase [Ideonella oryzae]